MEKEQLENIVDTLKDNQIEEVISVLKDRDIWFTSKNDPTFTEPSSYYTLDEYGCPAEKAIEDILKDCNDYVGDGAIDFTEAIDMWVEKCLADGKLAYIDYLVTTYKTKPVVDNIEAYEVKEIKTESKIEESEFANEDLLNDFTQYVANNAVELKNGLYEIEVPKELGYQPVLNTDMLKKAYMKVKKLFNLDNGDTSIIFESKKVESNNDSDILKKVKELLKSSYKYFYRNYTWHIDNGALYMDKDDGEVFVKQLEPGFNIEEVKVQKSIEGQPVEDVQYKFTLKDDTSIKTENYKTRLKEENTKSLNLISQMFQDDDFDANSNEGKIVVKTSELFNKLSDKGFDVQVNFDNGDSQSTILLSKQGGSVNITINNANDPLRAYTSGSFEVNNDTLKVLEDVQDVLNELN